MTNPQFPSLAVANFAATRDAIQVYAKLLGKVRRALTPRQKHWFHISLRAAAAGLTTTPIPAGSKTFEMLLDFTTHRLAITTSQGEQWQQPLSGQSAAAFCEEALATLAMLGLEPEIDRSLFSDTTPLTYDKTAAERLWQALSQIDAVFKQFKGELREETGPVQLWPHHVDLAMLWFSGRLVPGVDPADEENAGEQMNFGFAPGDAGIAEPYFYITAYPAPEGWVGSPLPQGAVWQTEGFKGAVMKYEILVEADQPAEKLLNFLRTVQQAGARLMR